MFSLSDAITQIIFIGVVIIIGWAIFIFRGDSKKRGSLVVRYLPSV